MIQRIQSVYLLIGSILLGLLHLFPFGKGNEVSESMLSDGLFNLQDGPMLLFPATIAAIVMFVSIFLFKQRKVQKMSVILAMFLLGMLMGFAVTTYFTNKDIFNSSNNFAFGLGAILPFASLVLGILSSASIAKDEKIVKSMDRLR